MEKSVESSIDLTAIFRLLLKKLWMLLLIGVVAGIIGFGISAFLLTPQYRSAATLYVASSQSDANANKTTSDIAVFIFVLFLMAIVTGMDLGLGKLMLWMFG